MSDSTSSVGEYSSERDVEEQQSLSSEGTSFQGFSKNSGTDKSSVSEEQLAAKETAGVHRLRFIVLAALFFAAAAVSIGVYLITSNAEEKEFEAQYEGFSINVLTSFEDIVSTKLAALASLGVTFTSYARSHSEKWPRVTMNDFQQRAANSRELSGALYMQLLPAVTLEDRLLYEQYVMENRGWIEEGFELQKEFGIGENEQTRRRFLQGAIGSDTLDFSTGIGDQIYRLGADYNAISNPSLGPYFPIWQASPVLVRNLVNFNVLTYDPYTFGITTAFETGKMAIGGVDVAAPGNSTDPDLETSFFAILKSFQAGKDVDYEGDPMSSVYIPVFDSPDVKDRKPVAVLMATLQWSSYFVGVLPPQAKGITVILENECDGSFTYKLSGDSVEYIGEGDLHE